MSRLLPAEFADLEDLIDWAMPTEKERYLKRLESTIEELQEVYDRLQARAKDAKEYLEELDYSDLPEEAQRLLWLLFSLLCISFAVEVFQAPRVPDTGSAYMERTVEPPTFPV
jgi:NTP pyrophosphatase (non-canonical NTP hydrolase)